MTVEVMSLIDEQGYCPLVLAHQFAQVAFAFLALGGNLYLFLGGQIVKQGRDESGQLDAMFLDGYGLGDGDFLLVLQCLLQPAQHHGLAAADYAANGDQSPLVDRAANVLHQLFMMGGFVVPGMTERHGQPEMLHDFKLGIGPLVSEFFRISIAAPVKSRIYDMARGKN